MKIAGWFFAFFGAINFIMGLVGFAQGVNAAGRSFITGLAFLGVSAIFFNQAAKKKKQQDEKDEWMNNK